MRPVEAAGGKLTKSENLLLLFTLDDSYKSILAISYPHPRSKGMVVSYMDGYERGAKVGI